MLLVFPFIFPLITPLPTCNLLLFRAFLQWHNTNPFCSSRTGWGWHWNISLAKEKKVICGLFFRSDALQKNQDLEFERNYERFVFLKWGAQALKNMLIVPPGSGIVHQVRLIFCNVLKLPVTFAYKCWYCQFYNCACTLNRWIQPWKYQMIQSTRGVLQPAFAAECTILTHISHLYYTGKSGVLGSGCVQQGQSVVPRLISGHWLPHHHDQWPWSCGLGCRRYILMHSYATLSILELKVITLFSFHNSRFICRISILLSSFVGIEAEAVMLGQAVSMVLPPVVGYRITGNLSPLATSTDVVLTITKVLWIIGTWFIQLHIQQIDRSILSNKCAVQSFT